jgi:hypothetical protein
MRTQAGPTDRTEQTDQTDPARRPGGGHAASHAAFAILVAATFAIFLALSLPLSRLSTQLHMFGSHGLLTPAGGPWSGVFGLPNELAPIAHPYGAPGENGLLSLTPIASGPADLAPPAQPGSSFSPPPTGGILGPGTGDSPTPKPPWWTNLTPAQRLAAERRMTRRHWNHLHADRHDDHHRRERSPSRQH